MLKDLDTENYKTLLQEIFKNLNNWRDIPCSWVRSLNILPFKLISRPMDRVNTIPIETPAGLNFVENDKGIFKFI